MATLRGILPRSPGGGGWRSGSAIAAACADGRTTSSDASPC